jgi:hypothetical protein
MKKIIPFFIAIAVITFVSCNGNTSPGESQDKMIKKDSMPIQQNTDTATDVKIVPVSFTNIDPAVTVYMKEMVQNYLGVKNALIDNNGSGAAAASDKISAAMKIFDKSLLSAEQKKVYDDIEEDLKEHAEHIGKNGDKVSHQREHFSMMSEAMYTLVKAFGAGITLYHDHCPMFNDGKGAIWLSETKEIRNPYYGEKMMTCGSVMEIFKQ